MALRVCVLGSGSRGNCTYVGSRETAFLIDAGLSGRETLRRLEEIGVRPQSIQGIMITHEHTDHISGLGTLCRRLGIPAYANAGTIEGVTANGKGSGLSWQTFITGSGFDFGDLLVEPFSVSHDGRDPVGYVVTGPEGKRLGGFTDMGTVTALVRERMRDCDVAIVEANHDEAMLRDAARPWSLKQRITGRQGHLSNRAAGELVADIATQRLSQVFLAHISSDCNTHELAARTVRDVVSARGIDLVRVSPTFHDRPSDVWSSEA